MPLLQRVIEPVHICRGCILDLDVPNELECVTNGTLANIIRQLSSLSKHAENMFTTLFEDSTKLVVRTNNLQGRVDRLAVKVTQLDSNIEEGEKFEVSLQDIHMRKAFKSCITYDQQVVDRNTMPAAMMETYKQCDMPPPLNKLNAYREDGKDGLKFYTDPNYFFDLWKQQMLKDTEKILHDRGKKMALSKEGVEIHKPRSDGKRHKKVRQPHNTREKYRMMANKDEFLDRTANYSHVAQYDAQAPVRPSSLELQSAYDDRYPLPPPAYTEPQDHPYPPPPPYTPDLQATPTRHPSRASSARPSQPPPAPPISSSASSSATSTPSSGAGRYHQLRGRDGLPPPPPPPENGFETRKSPTAARHEPCAVVPLEEPPLPPAPPTPDQQDNRPIPPPLPLPNGVPAPPPLPNNNNNHKDSSESTSTLSSKASETEGKPKTDARSDLLAAIREGIKLRRVEDIKQKEVEKAAPLHDVASILARRIAMEFSDSDSASLSDGDSDGWDDETEC